jgi:hypothetical protein
MFYESTKANWLAGKVRVVLPAAGHGEHVKFEADGLIGFKAAFLSAAERKLLAELAKSDAQAFAGRNLALSGKGKGVLQTHAVEAELMLKEYRHALINGLGINGDDYELICVSWLAGLSNVGVAFRLDSQIAYLLVDSACGQVPDYIPSFLLDAAKELTEFMRTFVVPDQASEQKTEWGSLQHGPITAYKFKLVDLPARVFS